MLVFIYYEITYFSSPWKLGSVVFETFLCIFCVVYSYTYIVSFWCVVEIWMGKFRCNRTFIRWMFRNLTHDQYWMCEHIFHFIKLYVEFFRCLVTMQGICFPDNSCVFMCVALDSNVHMKKLQSSCLAGPFSNFRMKKVKFLSRLEILTTTLHEDLTIHNSRLTKYETEKRSNTGCGIFVLRAFLYGVPFSLLTWNKLNVGSVLHVYILI
jgi:hypothetical protein